MARSFQKPLPEPVPGESPVNSLPPVILALFLAIAGIEAVLSLGATGMVGGPGAVGWRLGLLQRFAFSPVVFDYVVQGRQGDLNLLLRFVSYAFLHGSVTHALFAGALLLALGKFVGEAIGQAATLGVLLVATLGGALAFGAFANGTQPLFGCYAAVYGLIGAFTYMLWLRLGQAGENRLQAFRLSGGLMAVQLLFGVLFGANPQWIADVGGFMAGLMAATLLAPGGWAALRARLRAR